MKWFLSIANFGTDQTDYLAQMLDVFETYDCPPDIVIDTTDDLRTLFEKRKVLCDQRIFPRSIGTGLPYQHRRLFRDHLDEYDYFMYAENDLLIPEEAIRYIVEARSDLHPDDLMGFCRFEENSDGLRYLLDHDVTLPLTLKHAWLVNSRVLFSPFVLHSGAYLISRSELKRAIDSGGYLVPPHQGPYGVLEQGASDVYTQCGFRAKCLPVPVTPVLIHHLPNKYVSSRTANARLPVAALDVLAEHFGPEPKLDYHLAPSALGRWGAGIRSQVRFFEKLLRHWFRG